MMTRATSGRSHQGGFMLLEALIAILIFSIGILALVGMQSAAARYSTDAQFRTVAGYLVNQCLGQIWSADRTTLSKVCPDTVDLPALPKGNTRTATVTGSNAAGYTATVTVTWQLPGDSATHTVQSTTIIHDRCDTAGCT